MENRSEADVAMSGGPARRRRVVPRPSRTRARVGALFCLALAVGCAGPGPEGERSGASVLVRSFLEAIQDRRYEDARTLMTDAWRESLPPERMADRFAKVAERLGPLESLDLRGLRLGESQDRKEVLFHGTFERGEAGLVAIVVEARPGEVRLAGLRMDFRLRPEVTETPELPEGVTVLEGGSAEDRSDEPGR